MCPRAAPSACGTPMCAGMAVKGTLCEPCRKEKATTYRVSPERAKLNTFYQGTQWRSLSKAYRRRHPLCAHCKGRGITTPCDMTDHVVPIRTAWDRRYDPTNMQALCHQCHNIKTARDRRS